MFVSADVSHHIPIIRWSKDIAPKTTEHFITPFNFTLLPRAIFTTQIWTLYLAKKLTQREKNHAENLLIRPKIHKHRNSFSWRRDMPEITAIHNTSRVDLRIGPAAPWHQVISHINSLIQHKYTKTRTRIPFFLLSRYFGAGTSPPIGPLFLEFPFQTSKPFSNHFSWW